VVEWFRREKEAILIGTNVFTTGFNVPDVETVIVNRATKSLSLWIQMVGRGARTTDKVLKDHFTVVDLGQNIERHGIWSSERDWSEYFWPVPLVPKRQRNLEETWACSDCGALNPAGEVLRGDKLYCAYCDSVKKTDERRDHNKPAKDGELVVVDKIPLPSGNAIINYCMANQLNSDQAFKILADRILKLFSHYRVSVDEFLRKEQKYLDRVTQIYRPIYFAIIKSDLTGSRKAYKTQIKRMHNKIFKYYGLNGK
jgi:hypothetical protein